MIIKEEKDTRPVKCYICRRKMYYNGHSKFEPEFTVNVGRDYVYIHRKCLIQLRKQKIKEAKQQ